MARTTDRQHISEAIRLRIREVGDIWTVHSNGSATVSNEAGHELDITYSAAGRITKLVHWQPVEGTRSASRQPITTNKRQHALDVIKGETP